MTIEEEIVAWALRRPAWQQEVLTALARGEVFDEKRVPELADRLLDPVSTQASNEAKTLSLRSAALKRVRLVRVCNLRGVNALAESQTLSFAPEGLTVIFGGNGSGKSGYARLIKALANARHPAKVLPDVFRANPAEPSAELVYQVDGQEISQKYPCPEGVPDLLQMRFFDEHCGDEGEFQRTSQHREVLRRSLEFAPLQVGPNQTGTLSGVAFGEERPMSAATIDRPSASRTAS